MSDVAALAEQLRDQQSEVRATAAERLCQLGEAARPASTALVQATADTESVSTWAVAALEELGAPAPDTVPELVSLSANTHELVAYWALTLLGRLGPAARDAEEALTSALISSPHLAARERAAWALGKISPQSTAAIDALRQASQAADTRLAQLAARALATSEGQ